MTGQGMGVTALNALAMSTTYPGSLPPTLHPPVTAPAPITSATTTAASTMGAAATHHYDHAHAAAAAAHQAHGQTDLFILSLIPKIVFIELYLFPTVLSIPPLVFPVSH